MPIELSSSHLLELTGADAIAFAHGQFSNDVRALADEQWQWNAWLAANGRVRAFFALLRLDANRLNIILRGDGPVEFRDALSRFVLRADAKIRVVDKAHLYGAHGDTELARLNISAPGTNVISQAAERFAIALSPSRFIVNTDAATTSVDMTSDDEMQRWRLADIRDGLPEIAAALHDAALPHWLGLERLKAISVRKGCYPGQEIVSRLHFKGGNKRSLYRIAFQSDAIPIPGAAIVEENADEAAGQIVMAARSSKTTAEALAILPHASEGKPLRLQTSDALVIVIERFG